MKPPAPQTSAPFPVIGFCSMSLAPGTLVWFSALIVGLPALALVAWRYVACFWPRYRTSGETHHPSGRKPSSAHEARCNFYAAGASAERSSVTGTAVPIISSKTFTRPASSTCSSLPTKSANGPDRIRTRCPSRGCSPSASARHASAPSEIPRCQREREPVDCPG